MAYSQASFELLMLSNACKNASPACESSAAEWGGRFLEELEKRIRGLIGALLRDHALGVADHEHFLVPHRRRHHRALHDGPDCRDIECFVPAWRLIQPAVLETLGDALGDVVANVIQIGV